MPEWMREFCQVIGAVSLLTFGAGCTWVALVECSERNAFRRHSCADCETVDASTAYLNYRCMRCGRRRPLGIAWHVGTNRKRRRPA
jgi:hypothetical protein